MKNRRSRFWIISLLILVALVANSAGLEAQCMFASTPTGMVPPTYFVGKVLTAPASCLRGMTVNAQTCQPTNTMTSMFVVTLAAYANTATVNPSCNWICGCGPVTIDGSDGLPVELMNFSIESDAEGDADTEDPAPDEADGSAVG